jgi:tetratricopeptide (TPR) repeat protein
MDFAEAGGLLHQTASYLYERGQYAEAEPLYQRAMEIRRTALGETHPDYATSLNNLAGLYRAMGRHAEAGPLYRRAMEIRHAALGEGHPDYATSLNGLARLYRDMGWLDEAEPLFKQAMEIRRTALGEGNPDYADSLNGLARVYRGSDSNGEKSNDLQDDSCSEPLSQTMVSDNCQELTSRLRDSAET